MSIIEIIMTGDDFATGIATEEVVKVEVDAESRHASHNQKDHAGKGRRTEGATNAERRGSRASIHGTNEPHPNLPPASLNLSEVEALETYLGVGNVINTNIRQGLDNPKTVELRGRIDSAFEQSPGVSDDLTVYRIVPSSLGAGRPGWGDPPPFSDAGYQSTTFNKEQLTQISTTLGYNTSEYVTLEVTVPKGTPALQLSGDQFQSEILLPRGGTMAPKGDGTWVFQAP